MEKLYREQILTLPNGITIIRVIAIPFILVMLFSPNLIHRLVTAFFFFAVAITDTLDGYLARRRGMETTLGKFLDPLADKLLVTAALIALVYLQEVETWVAAIIILRELFISAFRFYYLVKNASFSASIPAKIKTTFQIVALSILIIYRRLPYANYIRMLGTAVLYVAVFLTVYSGAEYVIRFSRQSRK